MALIHFEMEGMEADEKVSDDESISDDEEEPEIPDTLFDMEISEEETTITDDKGDIHTKDQVVPICLFRL
jgi:hypothetical protein